MKKFEGIAVTGHSSYTLFNRVLICDNCGHDCDHNYILLDKYSIEDAVNAFKLADQLDSIRTGNEGENLIDIMFTNYEAINDKLQAIINK